MSSPSALPPVTTRILAFAAIAVAGLCGGLIGYAFLDLQCTGDCALLIGGATIIGAASAAGGVGLVVVLVLRAMGEWQTVKERPASAEPAAEPAAEPPDVSGAQASRSSRKPSA